MPPADGRPLPFNVTQKLYQGNRRPVGANSVARLNLVQDGLVPLLQQRRVGLAVRQRDAPWEEVGQSRLIRQQALVNVQIENLFHELPEKAAEGLDGVLLCQTKGLWTVRRLMRVHEGTGQAGPVNAGWIE